MIKLNFFEANLLKYHCYFYEENRSGYVEVAWLSKKKTISIKLGKDGCDCSIKVNEYPEFSLLIIYSPYLSK